MEVNYDVDFYKKMVTLFNGYTVHFTMPDGKEYDVTVREHKEELNTDDPNYHEAGVGPRD